MSTWVKSNKRIYCKSCITIMIPIRNLLQLKLPVTAVEITIKINVEHPTKLQIPKRKKEKPPPTTKHNTVFFTKPCQCLSDLSLLSSLFSPVCVYVHFRGGLSSSQE